METPHQPILEQIENLFLVGRFDEALHLCIQQLRECFGFDFHSQRYVSHEKQTQETQNEPSTSKNLKPTTLQTETSVPLLSLLIQILYELERSDEIMNLILNFYGSLEQVPFDILFIWFVFF
jgi:hypothetical protein